MKRLVKKEKIDENTTRYVYEGTRDDQIADLEETLKVAGDAETKRYFERAIESVKKMGRKPKPTNKVRRHTCLARFNDEEYRQVADALGDEIEFAAGLRELALEAARARLNAR